MSRKPILVIEDDPDIRENLQEFLESEGYTVELAGNGQEGLDRLRANPTRPGLVLLDLMMPVMDGKTFLRQLAADSTYDDLPVVVFTAAAELLTDRIVGFMRKPVDLDRILEVVAKYCGA